MELLVWCAVVGVCVWLFVLIVVKGSGSQITKESEDISAKGGAVDIDDMTEEQLTEYMESFEDEIRSIMRDYDEEARHNVSKHLITWEGACGKYDKDNFSINIGEFSVRKSSISSVSLDAGIKPRTTTVQLGGIDLNVIWQLGLVDAYCKLLARHYYGAEPYFMRRWFDRQAVENCWSMASVILHLENGETHKLPVGRKRLHKLYYEIMEWWKDD